MSLIMDILEELWNINLSYKGMTVNMFGVPVGNRYKKESRYSTLSRLRKKGLIENIEGKYKLTTKGKEYFSNRKKLLKKFQSPFKPHSPKNLLFMFDIHEARKNERFWLRSHLIDFGFFMLQKSVWIGPSPLPKNFIDYIKEINLSSCIKTFKLANPYHK